MCQLCSIAKRFQRGQEKVLLQNTSQFALQIQSKQSSATLLKPPISSKYDDYDKLSRNDGSV